MIKQKLLLTATVSVVLATSIFAAGNNNCLGGVCFVNLDKLQPTRGFENKQEHLLVLEKPRYIDELNINGENMDKTTTIVLDGETISVFPHSSYVMTEEEKNNYLANEEANKDLLMLTRTVNKIEDKILDKIDLPISEYFCEKNTKPLYNEVSDSFQCVS